jgi:hypothetical protein
MQKLKNKKINMRREITSTTKARVMKVVEKTSL